MRGDGCVLPNGYRQIHRDGKQWLEHRWLWEQANGPIPAGHLIHHVNHDRADNRLENLQLMTRAMHTSHHQKGASKSPETRAKMSAAAKGRPKSEEHRVALANAAHASSAFQAHIAKLNAAKKGKPLSADHRAKVGRKGHPYYPGRWPVKQGGSST
jgi:hypothetical protein